MLTAAQKAQLWADYHAGRPTRVPVALATNPRIILQDPALNPDGYTFVQASEDPAVHVRTVLLHQLHVRTTLNRYTDGPTSLPDVWEVCYVAYNVYEAAYFGCPLVLEPDQPPDTRPVFTDDASREDIFKVDIEHPMENPYIRKCLAFADEMARVCEGLRFEGRPVRMMPWGLSGSDGPVTVACNLRGAEFLAEMAGDPDYARRLLRFVTDAAILRRRAFAERTGNHAPDNWLADDSILCLSTAMYADMVLPEHRRFYDAGPDTRRTMHLCGDATRHFPIIHEALGVTSFDTGFPVDHGRLRRQLGDDVEIRGGVEIKLLLDGTPDQVYRRATDILKSGVMRGGRFILTEANNLPPRCPLANLEAMYQAALDHGRYESERK